MLFLSQASAQAYCESQNNPIKSLSEDSNTIPDLCVLKSEPTDTNVLLKISSLYPCDSLLCANIITYQRPLSFDTLISQEEEEFSDTSWEIGDIILFAFLAGTSSYLLLQTSHDI